MGIPWYLNPLWSWDMHDKLDELELSSDSSQATDQRQDKELSQLKLRVTELENQLLTLEKILLERGILPPPPPPQETPPIRTQDTPAVFPTRTEEAIACPRCRRRQKGNRNTCYACGLPFQYEDES